MITTLTATNDAAARTELLAKAQTMISEEYVNGYLFQFAYPVVADARLKGLWTNQPTQGNPLTEVTWE